MRVCQMAVHAHTSGRSETLTFTAEGENKKQATQACAEKALACRRLEAIRSAELSKKEITLDDAFTQDFRGRVLPASAAAWEDMRRSLEAHGVYVY